MKTRYITHFVPLALALSGALLLAACTRSANDPGAIPQATATTGSDVVPTTDGMSDIATQISAQQTATAIAILNGGGGGAEPSPTVIGGQPVVTDVPQPIPTDTPIGIVPPTMIPIDTPVVPVATVPPTALPPGVACANPYEVKAGDWIYKIARLCGVLPKDIIAANPGINPDLIYPGQTLNMPTPGATAVKLCSGTYTVKSGDTLFRIAYNCGFTAEELAVANGITFPYIIKPGQVIKFP